MRRRTSLGLAAKLAAVFILIGLAFGSPAVFADESDFCAFETDTCCNEHPGGCTGETVPCKSFVCGRSTIDCFENCTYMCCELEPE